MHAIERNAMNFYNEIKNELINNEINTTVKNYSINKSDLNMTKVKIKNPDNPAILNMAYLITYSK